MSELYDIFLNDPEILAHKYEHYFSVYERYLARYREQPIVMLEIGVDRGGSLKLWRRYFGPQAKIYAIDIKPECVAHAGGNVEVFIGSQADKSFLKTVLDKTGPLDIVLDDGSHRAPDQIASFEAIYPHVKPSGVYIVEDLHTSYWPKFNRRMFYKRRLLQHGFLDFCKMQIDSLNSFHWNRKSFKWFAEPRDQRRTAAPASDFARLTRSISFHDSMVVFERGDIAEPLRIRKE